MNTAADNTSSFQRVVLGLIFSNVGKFNVILIFIFIIIHYG